MTLDNKIDRFLTGQLIMSMPAMYDIRFMRAVIYICMHNDDGAMGIVINRLIDDLNFDKVLNQLDIPIKGKLSDNDNINIHFGGPVEIGRGFVLHSDDYSKQGTVALDNCIGLTASLDILSDIASGDGPEEKILALGYAGWGPGQLEAEIKENTWLHCPSDADLIFGDDIKNKWHDALSKIGVDISMLSSDAGHA